MINFAHRIFVGHPILDAPYKCIGRPIWLYRPASWHLQEIGAGMTKSEDAEMCDMRGMLSFTILWLLSKNPMCGQVLAAEIEKRRGEKPNPGTIYPALKELANRGSIKAHPEGQTMVYELTPYGHASLSKSLEHFKRSFGDIFYSAPKVRER